MEGTANINTEAKIKEVWLVTTINEMVEMILKSQLTSTERLQTYKVFTTTTGETIIRAVVEMAQPEQPTEPVEESPVENAEEILLNVLNRMFRYEEGYKLEEYLDSKKYPTIGIGHLITKHDRTFFKSNEAGKLVITDADSEMLFKVDVENSIAAAKKWMGEYWNTLSINRRAVVVGMAFQMGVNALSDFGPTREHIIRGEWEDVKQHFLGTKWYKDTPKRVVRMAEIMVTDQLPKEYFA